MASLDVLRWCLLRSPAGGGEKIWEIFGSSLISPYLQSPVLFSWPLAASCPFPCTLLQLLELQFSTDEKRQVFSRTGWHGEEMALITYIYVLNSLLRGRWPLYKAPIISPGYNT